MIFKSIIIIATFLELLAAAEIGSPIASLHIVHAKSLITVTSIALFSLGRTSAKEFEITGRFRQHVKFRPPTAKFAESAKGGKKGKPMTGKSKKYNTSSKSSKSIKSNKSNKSRKSWRRHTVTPSTPTPTSTPTPPPGRIFMTIGANFNVSDVFVEKRRRRQLVVTEEDITTVMKNTIRDVVKRSLNSNQSLVTINVTGINEFSRNGSPAGTTIDSQLLLMENCTSTSCEAQLSTTTMNSTVISFMAQEINNGGFTEIFRKNAAKECVGNTCQEIIKGSVTEGIFNETKRGVVVLGTQPPTTANPTSAPITASPTKTGETNPPTVQPTSTPTSTPTSAKPTSTPTALPTSPRPTTPKPTSTPTSIPTSTPTTA